MILVTGDAHPLTNDHSGLFSSDAERHALRRKFLVTNLAMAARDVVYLRGAHLVQPLQTVQPSQSKSIATYIRSRSQYFPAIVVPPDCNQYSIFSRCSHADSSSESIGVYCLFALFDC